MKRIVLTPIVLLLALLGAQGEDVRGFICEPVIPTEGMYVFDFSLKGSLEGAVWRYALQGDTAMSVTRQGPWPTVREDLRTLGDTAWAVCRECRAWVSRDTPLVAAWTPTATEGTLHRKVRRYMSEHYILEGSYMSAPIGRCTAVLAEGDTARDVTLVHRTERFTVRDTDSEHASHSDSVAARVTRDIWQWGFGPREPMLACTEVTVTENLYTGEMRREEWTAVFPRRDNPEVWPMQDGATRSVHNATHGARYAKAPMADGTSSDTEQMPWEEPQVWIENGVLTINTGTSQRVAVVVTDIAGRVMHSCEGTCTVSLTTGGWPYGEYVVKAGDMVKKIILMP